MAVVDVTTENFDKIISTNEMVLLDFWAEWCGPCKNFAPVFEEASEKHPNVVFGKVNTEEQKELAQMFDIRSIPMLVLFREGVVLFAESGSMTLSAMSDLIEKAANLDMDKVRKDIDGKLPKQESQDS